MYVNYTTFRQILAIPLYDDKVKTRIEDIVAGTLPELSTWDLLLMAFEMEADAKILRILGHDPSVQDGMDQTEILFDFFDYCRGNWPRLVKCLDAIGYKVTAQTTPSSVSK